MDTAPLIVTADEHLREQLLRLAAAAGVAAEVASAFDGDRRVPRAWTRAAAVLVGADQAPALACQGTARRAGVTVCATASDGPDDPALLRAGLALGAERVVALPRDEAAVVGALADLGEPDGAGPAVAVVGGSGGAGASVLAATLAERAAVRGPTLLVDLDPLGPGAARLLGIGVEPAVGWSDLERGSGRLGAGALREAVPRSDSGVGVLGWPGPTGVCGVVGADTVREALGAAVRGHRAVVLDLPRSDLAGRGEVLDHAAAVVLVCRATLAGASAAARLRRSGALAGPEPLLVVRGARADADRIGRVLGLDPTAVLAEQRGLEESLALGLGPVGAGRPPRGRGGALVRAADAVWRAVPGGSGLAGTRG